MKHDLRVVSIVALGVTELIQSECSRIFLVGSAGRLEPLVGDLDILCEPKSTLHIPAIRRKLKQNGTWIRGADRMMVVNNIFNTDIKLDLFLCHPPAQWGVLMAVRLNPVRFVIWAKAKLDSLGYQRKDGALFLNGQHIPVPDEETYFRLLGLDYCKSSEREDLCRKLGLDSRGFDNGSSSSGSFDIEEGIKGPSIIP